MAARYNWAELFSLVIIPLAVTAEVEWVRWRGSGGSITYLGHTISERAPAEPPPSLSTLSTLPLAPREDSVSAP